MHTLLLNGPTGREYLNYLYTVPTTTSVPAHFKAFNSNQAAEETINNMYELPSLTRAVRYLLATTGFPTKSTWLKSTRNGNYLTWPLLTIHNANKHFLESEETHKGHMRNQRQGVFSTNAKDPHTGTESPPAYKNVMSSSICMNPRVPCTQTKRESYLTG